MRTQISIAVGLVVAFAATEQNLLRVERKKPITITAFSASHNTILYCPFSSLCQTGDRRIKLNTVVAGTQRKLTYTYKVTAGRIEGEGSTVKWDLEGVPIGQYAVTVSVENSQKQRATADLTVTIAPCDPCHPPPPRCPQITVDCPAQIDSGKLITFVANVIGGESYKEPSYTWRTDAGKIVDGKYAKQMTLDLLRFPFEKVTATVLVDGFDPACAAEASCTTIIK